MSPRPAGRFRVLLLLALWLVPAAASLCFRPLLPVDETRYLSVAWEMHRSDTWLVPILNGRPYSDKPPLLFWLIRIGWMVAGVGEMWARLLSPLAALLALFLTIGLGRRLWPDGGRRGEMAGILLSATLLWMVYAGAVLFDVIEATCCLLAWHGLLVAVERPRKGFALFALALGLGLLAKGPVALLLMLPTALIGPWWSGLPPTAKARWYGGLFLATTGGIALVLLWALPAASAGGEAYARAILWRQTAGRVVDSFAHRRPWWWYTSLLPVAGLPWTLWPPLWRSAARAAGRVAREGALVLEPSVRFCLGVLVPAFLGFSLISGKQLHYLVPIAPVGALLAARALGARPGARFDLLPFGLLVSALGLATGPAVAWSLPHLQLALPPVFATTPSWMLVVLGLGLFGFGTRVASAVPVVATAVATVAAFALVEAAAAPALGAFFDAGPAAQVLARLEAAGRPIGHVGRYQGQFHFLGRLQRPIVELEPAAVQAWLARNRAGVVIRRGPVPAGDAGSNCPLVVEGQPFCLLGAPALE